MLDKIMNTILAVIIGAFTFGLCIVAIRAIMCMSEYYLEIILFLLISYIIGRVVIFFIGEYNG